MWIQAVFSKNQLCCSVCVEDFEILPAPKGPLWPQEAIIRHMLHYHTHNHTSKLRSQIYTYHGCVCVLSKEIRSC